VVGLTGGIATGKSTVSSLLKNQGIPLVDADVLARIAVLPGSRGYSQIVKHFGQDILSPDGSIDRKKLGAIIFNDLSKRKILNGIVHPAVRRLMLWEVLKAWLTGKEACVLDVPLLIEAGLSKWVGMIVVVYSSKELQLARLVQRDQCSTEDAMSRISSQMAIDDKLPYADIVIDNSGSLEDVEARVTTLATKLKSNRTYIFSWLCPPFGLFLASITLIRRTWRGICDKEL